MSCTISAKHSSLTGFLKCAHPKLSVKTDNRVLSVLK